MEIKTYYDAIAAGYVPGDIMLQRGYVSRKVCKDTQPVHIAGGRRKGQLYILLPNWESTQYCYRLYLVKKYYCHELGDCIK